MSTFTAFNSERDFEFDPVVSAACSREHWRVLNPFSFYYKHGKVVMKVMIPHGFCFTGKTIPLDFWEIASPVGRYPQLSILHEYLCEEGEVLIDGAVIKIPLEIAHQILLQAATVLRMGASRYRMLDLIKSAITSGTGAFTDNVKNNADGRLYGNEALRNIRVLLQPTQNKDIALC